MNILQIKMRYSANNTKNKKGGGPRLKYILLGLIICFLIAGAALGIAYSSKTWSEYFLKQSGKFAKEYGFVINEIYIDGCENLAPKELLAYLDIKNGDIIFSKSPWVLKEKLEKLEWIRSSVVDRQLPDKIYIGIRERKPIAIKQYNKNLQLIDVDGKIFTTKKMSDFTNLPIFVGDDVEDHVIDVIGFLKSDKNLYEQIDSVQRIGNRRWDIILKNKTTVKLPEVDPAEAWGRFEDMINGHKFDLNSMKAVDLRVDKKIFLEKREN